MKAIITENLTKSFTSERNAVDALSLSLNPGEVFGFLGPNGAGKTTTVKLLNGMLSPSYGTCQVFGLSPHETPEEAHRLSGVVTEHAQMYDTMTGIENLLFYGSVFGLSASDCRTRAHALLERLDLSAAADKLLAAYSTGMRQRLSLARAMIHQPRILFLDEPTSGLDPESAKSVNDMIQSLAEQEGTTVFLCTHQLRYAQEICSVYGLMDNGVLLASGSLEALRAQVFSGLTVQVISDKAPKASAFQKTGERSYETTVQDEEDIPELVAGIIADGVRVYHISSQRLSLEQIYFKLLDKAGNRRTANA